MKYLIIQTDWDDYYVECPTEQFFERLCACVPHTSEFRGWHGSNEKEGRELGHKGSVEIFGRDIIAIAEGTEKAPWNPERFKEQLKLSIGEEYVYGGTANVVITTSKVLQPFELTPENSIILGMTNLMFFANDYQHPVPWLRATDNDVFKVIRSAKKWLEKHLPWNIDGYYKHLLAIFQEDPRIIRDTTETTDPLYHKDIHDRIVLDVPDHPIVADTNRVQTGISTFVTWGGATNELIDKATNYVQSLLVPSAETLNLENTMTEHKDEIPSCPLVLPRSDVPTYKELAMWLAEGRGELLDLNNFNTVKHTLDYPLDKENECLHPLDVCYYRVRVKDDITWRKPDIKSMGIQRWDIAKFSVYIATKYENVVKVSMGLLGPDLCLGNLRLANFATGAVTEIGESLGELKAFTTVPWDKLTDKDVMLLEKDIQKLINEHKV